MQRDNLLEEFEVVHSFVIDCKRRQLCISERYLKSIGVNGMHFIITIIGNLLNLF